MRTLFVVMFALVLGGCAAPSLYQWGGYETMLYRGYKDPTKMEVMRVELEAHVSATEKSGQKVAPGLYAEVGTLYLQIGAKDKAIAMYTRERETWPESRVLMDTMIKSIEQRGAPRGETAK